MPQDERGEPPATPDTSENDPPEPAAFRSRLRLDAASPARFGELMTEWQRADFEAMDAAWLAVAGLGDVPGLRKSWEERPRGHSKTTDLAVELSWVMLYAARALRGYVVAADVEQAALVTGAIAGLQAANPDEFEPLDVARVSVRNKATGAELRLMGRDVASSFGITPDFLICDELTHWPKEGAQLWPSLRSSAAKRPHCLLAIRTNAGWCPSWQWQLREVARSNPDRWHFSTMDGPHAPWLDPAELAEQEKELRREDYERLWLNRWQGAYRRQSPRFTISARPLHAWDERRAAGLLGW